MAIVERNCHRYHPEVLLLVNVQPDPYQSLTAPIIPSGAGWRGRPTHHSTTASHGLLADRGSAIDGKVADNA